jgi:ribosomal protein S18 acetylase RimI-like enzyme
LIEYRPFRNNDAPLLAEIWRSQVSQRGLMQPMSVALLESLVLAKPTFDRLGLVLAVDDGKPLGFAHAGFGATADEAGISPEVGVISMLMLRMPDTDPAVAGELLRRSETYLRSRGAKAIMAGGSQHFNQFYLGLYGGSELSGILGSDAAGQAFFTAHGYREIERSRVLHRELGSFRPVVDRQQMQIRRRTSLQVSNDPPASSWWDACTFGAFERTLFKLQSRDGGELVARAMFWDMELLATTWGVHAVGLIELEVATAERHRGLATYLLGEGFRHLHNLGAAVVETHVPEEATVPRSLFAKLGFEEVDQSVIYRKELDSAAK